jgi:hypothetical protein
MRAHKPLRRKGSARFIEESAAPVESAEDAGLCEREVGLWDGLDVETGMPFDGESPPLPEER